MKHMHILFALLFSSVTHAQDGKFGPITYSVDKETTLSVSGVFKEDNKVAEMKVLKGGKEIQKMNFELFAPPMAMNVLNNGPFNAGSKAIGLSQSYEACDYPAGETVFIWDGKKVIKGPDVHVSNGEGMIAEMSYQFKWLPKCLQVDRILTPDMTVEENKGRKVEVNSHYYAWDGKALTQSARCPK